MKRSILAIGVGLAIFVLFGMLTRATWGGASGNSVLFLFGGVVGMLVAGYVTAWISRRAYIAHTLGVAVLCIVASVIVGYFTGVHHDWARWAVGTFSAILFTTWSGLFRCWQISTSQKSYVIVA